MGITLLLAMSSFSPSNLGLQNQASLLGSGVDGLSSPSSMQIQMTNLQTGALLSSSMMKRQSVEEFLKSEFNKLSVDEQVKTLSDVYSAELELKENPAMINGLLTKFEEEVERGNYPVYQLAKKQDRSYVEDPAFRLKFMRAKRHAVKEAVKQMIAFLFQKAKWFGVETIARDITIDDLTPDDLKLMLSGRYHIQDGADRSGRVIFYDLSSNLEKDMGSQIRVLYYIWFNILIPIHSVQMKGVVSIVDSVLEPSDQCTIPSQGDMKLFFEFAACLPLRVSAFHLCVKQERFSPRWNIYLQSGLTGLPKHTRERTRVHEYGSAIELQCELSTYGVPQDTLPVDLGGKMRENRRNIWMYKHYTSKAARQLVDESDDLLSDDEVSVQSLAPEAEGDNDLMSNTSSDLNQPTIVSPPYSPNDVLLGRGHDIQNHPGNASFRKFVVKHQDAYDSAPRLSKREITKNLTRALMAQGIRFWEKTDEDVWTETHFDNAERKVGQVFRSARKKHKC